MYETSSYATPRVQRFALITRNPSQASLSRAQSPGSAREPRVSGVNSLYHSGHVNARNGISPSPFHSPKWEVGGGRWEGVPLSGRFHGRRPLEQSRLCVERGVNQDLSQHVGKQLTKCGPLV